MKKTVLISILLMGFMSVMGQISITADSMVVSKWDVAKGGNVKTMQVQENMSMEIDKDLLSLRVYGTTKDMAYIEKAYIIDFLEMNDARDKWLFKGSDKNCVLCTITLDVSNKQISFITLGNDNGFDKPLITIYYTLKDVKINFDPIEKHLLEKGNRKFD